MIPDVKFIEEMIASFTVKSGDISLRKQLLVFLGMSFVVTDITQFSNEAKETWNSQMKQNQNEAKPKWSNQNEAIILVEAIKTKMKQPKWSNQNQNEAIKWSKTNEATKMKQSKQNEAIKWSKTKTWNSQMKQNQNSNRANHGSL